MNIHVKHVFDIIIDIETAYFNIAATKQYTKSEFFSATSIIDEFDGFVSSIQLMLENFGYSLDVNRPSPFNDEDLGQMSHYIYCHKQDNGKVIECEFFIRISNHQQDFEDKQRQNTYFGTGGVEQVEKTTGMSVRRYKIRRITYDNEEYRTYDEVLDEVWDRIEKWS